MMTPKNDIPFVFFGSPPIGPIALRVLEQNKYMPAAIVTDTKLTTDEQVAIVEENKAGFILVVGYGAILKQGLLDSVAGQALNIHPSMLPLYRGPAPVVQAILDGVKETGVSLMQIDSKMDHGDIVAQESHLLHGKETPDELYELLTQKGARLFLENIDAYLNEEIDLIPQFDFEATFTKFITKEDGHINLNDDPQTNERKIRAYQGWPGAWLTCEGKRLIIHSAHLAEDKLWLDEVQPESSKRMSFAAFAAGKRMKPEELYEKLR
ncbi:MAG TPA: methionyl-tRNA formyltransferase [Verrucomicrobiae bacterium]|nr:methionyl-tRNA formyltransferase [Verrucomicrobiae bacterium]